MKKKKQSPMEEVSISQFKATCLALLARVKRTQKPILVLRKGEPIAQVVPPPLPSMPQSWLGSFSSSGEILGEIINPAAEPETGKPFIRELSFGHPCIPLERA